jgi:hypothetical protein
MKRYLKVKETIKELNKEMCYKLNESKDIR